MNYLKCDVKSYTILPKRKNEQVDHEEIETQTIQVISRIFQIVRNDYATLDSITLFVHSYKVADFVISFFTDYGIGRFIRSCLVINMNNNGIVGALVTLRQTILAKL